MTFEQLYYYVIISETKNISKAAELAFISTSGMSKALARLEAEIGVPLFNRTSNRILLNNEGKIFLDFAKKSLIQQNNCLREIRRAKEKSRSYPEIVRIAVPSENVLFGMQEELTRDMSNVMLSQHLMGVNQAEQALLNHEIDIAISHYPIYSPQIKCTLQCRERLLAVMSRENDLMLRGMEEIPLTVLSEIPLILQEYDSDVNRIILSYYENEQIEPVVFHASGKLMHMMIKENQGLSFFRERIMFQNDLTLPETIMLPVADPRMELCTYISILKNEPLPPLIESIYQKLFLNGTK